MRPSATIIIPAWNEWALTRSCLETLRPTLGVRDQVVVVDNGSQDGTASGLRRYPWVTVVSHEQNLGFAAGCNSGAAVATGEVLVFLNNDTLLPSRWLDGLLAPMADPSVAATGPRSNFVSGPQLVEDVPYDATRTADLQRFSRTWREEHRGQTTPVTRLVGFCLAVRRDAFTAIGGFDEAFGIGGAEDDDLCLRLVDAGHQLLIAHESFVHHHGHRTFAGNGVDWYALQEQNLDLLTAKRGARQRSTDQDVRISACMIVKNEEADLPSCLAALEPLVDEVVVYDTGSTDGTIDVARAAGAHVIEGYWDDDFGRARNAALDACTGTWILHVDADEVVEGKIALIRQELRELSAADALTVAIGNVDDTGEVGIWHTATRLFRRGRARWSGRLHEQIVAVDGRALRGGPSSLKIRHFGYTSAAVASRDKMERNLRVAELTLAERQDDAFALINVGRSLTGVGRNEEAVERFSLALERTTDEGLRRQALRFGVEVLLGLGRPAEALGWVEDLRSSCPSSTMPDYFEGLARFNLGELDTALMCFERIGSDDSLTDGHMELPSHHLAARKGLALLAACRWEEAAGCLLSAVLSPGTRQELWTPLIEAHVRGGLALPELIAIDADPRALTLLGHATNASADAGQAVALHLWERPAARLPVVAFLGRLAPRLPLEDVLDWSLRLRSNGLGDHCPVHDYAADDQPPPLERLKAVAVLSVSLGDHRAAGLLPAVVDVLQDDDMRTALLLLDELAPALLPELLAAVARGGDRIAPTVQALAELGALEQAQALRELLAV